MNDSTQLSCRLSGEAFTLRAAEKSFYEKAAPVYGGSPYPLSAPRFLPEVRSQLRCLFRNERSLYRRECDLSGKPFISMYAPEVSFPVYSSEQFFSDGWNAFDYGRDYDSSRPFFEQLADLHAAVPRLGIINKQCQNSEYCNYSYENKNCYLTFGSHYEEDCYYGAYSTKNTDCVDCFWMYGSELCYECLFSGNCYNCVHVIHGENCTDCWFSRDLIGCKNCLFCANLHQKQYCIFNKQLSKDEYFEKLKSYRLDTYSGFEKARQLLISETFQRIPVRALYQTQCQNCHGSTLSNCKNMYECYFCADSEDCAYARQIDGTVDSMDMDFMGYDKSQLCYQTIGCLGLFQSIACNACWNGSDLAYCQYCFGCSNCFGCISLQQQSYCILNKQYQKDDYQTIAAKIATELTQKNRWGEFFPPKLSPFGYNESMAQHLYPLTQAQAEESGFHWRPEEDTVRDVEKVIDASQVPDAIADVPDDILRWAIRSANSSKPFRIVKQELSYYRKLGVPIPRITPEERQIDRMQRRHPCKLWERECQKTGEKTLSTFHPDQPEVVYSQEAFKKTFYG